jgi:DNA-directed RNA polymerase specialized sigma24 family protein
MRMTDAALRVLRFNAMLRARLLVALAGFPAADVEDLAQELLLDCLRRAPWFDPARGSWEGFVRGVMLNRAGALVARRRRLVREISVERLAEMAATSGGPAAYCGADPATALIISLDTQRIISTLPRHLRAIALLLQRYGATEISELTGKSRSRVYQLILQIREAFVRAHGCGPQGRAGNLFGGRATGGE